MATDAIPKIVTGASAVIGSGMERKQPLHQFGVRLWFVVEGHWHSWMGLFTPGPITWCGRIRSHASNACLGARSKELGRRSCRSTKLPSDVHLDGLLEFLRRV